LGRLNFAVLQHVAADKYLKTCGLTSVLQCRTRLQSFYTGFPILKCLWDSGPPENTVPANSSRMPIHFRGSLASYSKLLTLSNKYRISGEGDRRSSRYSSRGRGARFQKAVFASKRLLFCPDSVSDHGFQLYLRLTRSWNQSARQMARHSAQFWI
jgi:hypothetical protein